MAEKLMTDGSMALREKQYRVITIEATEKPQNAKLRVAAYARVSSDLQQGKLENGRHIRR